MSWPRASLLCGLLSGLAACAGPQLPPTGPSDPGAPIEPQADWVEVSVVFEPALPESGELFVEHESGWSYQGPASPSGVDLRMPEGPASLRLRVGGRDYEHEIKASSAGADCIVRWGR